MSKVTTPAGLTYVKDFSFPAAQGFSGSAGSNEVKGYMRGGAVKKAPVKKAKGGTTMRDGRDMHSQLYDQGMQMGFMRGGQVKKMGMPTTRGPQATMDTGNQPARKGRNQAEIEAGGTKKMKPGYKEGGEVHSIRGVASSGGGALADAALKKAKAALRSKRVMKKPEKAGTAASKKGMPKNVKMAGGMVRKARGGSVKK
tara:strand:- start:661 stop:1257 length:597 start_codon:yes stop_codon:yes gene_type:complete